MTKQPATCTAQLRAASGPCEYPAHADGEPCGGPADQHHPGMQWANHRYLGPSLGVCGHEEEVHVMIGGVNAYACRQCFEASDGQHVGPQWDHAFTTPEPADG